MDRRTDAEREHIAVMRSVIADLAGLPLALKGGTALLFCYGLDRFSEDIDLDGAKKLNLENRIRAALTRCTSGFDLRVAKDTDTVQRYKAHYRTPAAEGNLKIEVSYRTGFDEADIALVDGIKTYRVGKLIDQKLSALEGRTAARDLYDVAFLAERYPNEFSPAARERVTAMMTDLNDIESRFRPAFEDADLFAERANVDETILRLQAAIQRPTATLTNERDTKIQSLRATRSAAPKDNDYSPDR